MTSMDIIDISSVLQEFKEHIDSYPRTVLSARFGDGKTYMLNQFIDIYSKAEKGKDNYYFITLHPVNYSVGKNEDVFEYIKRDILVRLEKENLLDDIDLNTVLDTVGSWSDIKSLFQFILGFHPMGGFFNKLIDYADNKYNLYQENCHNYKKYESLFKTQRGGLYENDAYTELIKSALKTKSEERKEEGKTKTCLIIEDLDRIDPAHLFRILNVLAAHIDDDENTNKFGFDNIILVMDYEVTGHIFHHFYGENANYEGYMAKFFSKYPFYYSLNYIAQQQLRHVLVSDYHLPKVMLSVDYKDEFPIGQIEPSTLDYAIKKLSVRDVKHVIDDLESQIKNRTLLLKEINETIVTLTPLAIYLSVMVRLDVNYDTNIIKKNICKLGSICLDVINTFMLVNADLSDGTAIIFQDKGLHIIRVKDQTGHLISNIEIHDSYSHSDAVSLSDAIEKPFNETCKIIKDIRYSNMLV